MGGLGTPLRTDPWQPLVQRNESRAESEVLADILRFLNGESLEPNAQSELKRYIQLQHDLSCLRAKKRIDAEVAAEYVKIAMEEAARRAAEDDEYNEHEKRKGLAFELLPAGQAVYIPMAPRFEERGLKGIKRMRWKKATLDHQSKFDKYPTAKMVYPVSDWHWKDLCFQWLFDAGLDIADLLSDLNMCASLAMSEHSVKVSGEVKWLYITMTLLSFLAEMVLALINVLSSDRVALDEIHCRYPVWRRGRCPSPRIIMVWMKFVFLRYLAVPERLISPHSTFVTVDHGGKNTFLPFDHPDLARPSDRPEEDSRHKLAIYVTDHVRYEYRVVEGYLTKVPKFIMEDIIVFFLALYMTWHQRSSAAIWASLTGSFSFVWGTYKLCNYARAARDKRKMLVAHLEAVRNVEVREKLEKDKAEFDSNPVRRLIATWCPDCRAKEDEGEEEEDEEDEEVDDEKRREVKAL